MDVDILNTAGSALISERLRMDVIASNLANANTTHDVDGKNNPYKRKVVQFQELLDERTGLSAGVAARTVEDDSSPLQMVFDPGHPDADEQGYVKYPNVSVEREMVDMVTAKAAYEANVQTIQVFKSMFNASLEL
ncbi:MAG: flagellar basal body rod protein FlgC [Candidatus Melainabacteria bacterium]|nr:flagellar basal body rod protein FlgC [Candidatus Melainabacteria bacterium]